MLGSGPTPWQSPPPMPKRTLDDAARLVALTRELRGEQARLARAWAATERKLARLRDRGEGDSREYWLHLARACEGHPPAFLGGGIRSVAQLVRTLPGVSRRRFDRNVLVARSFDDAAWRTLDRSLLEEIALLERGRGRTRAPIDPHAVRVRIEDASGRVHARRAVECTVAELRAARGERGPPPSLEAALRAEPALAGVRVRARGGRLSILGVPDDALGALRNVVSRLTRGR